MFASLSERLQGVFASVRRETRLTPESVESALREIRMALLEADVNFRVVKAFIDRVRDRAVDRDVLGSLTPSQQVVAIVRDELRALLGDGPVGLSTSRQRPQVVLLLGLQGDGKTTTTHLLHHILQQRFPGRVGLVSTLVANCGDEEQATGLHVTSPPAPQLQAYLARMVTHGLTHAVLEMTSHGLAQGRVQGVQLAAAVLTNIQHEHLDFHGGWEDYRAAKGRMFEYLRVMPAIRVINADDDASQVFAEAPCTTFGYGEAAEFRAEDIREARDGLHYRLHSASGSVDIHSPLSGVYNAANGAAAAAAATPFIAGDLGAIQKGIATLRYLPGRMEQIDEGQKFRAIVDFAHTPAALREALRSARRLLSSGQRLCVVFGSAGLRDVAKRRLMAEIATELADYVVLTAEDPRTESLDEILAMMAVACRDRGGQDGSNFTSIPDRGAALHHACRWARAGDIVLACGKGHEQSMCFGTTEYPWDDREAMRAALRGDPLRNLPTAQR